MKAVAAVLALLAAGAYADVWAQFCDDNACSLNCGESVDIGNTGCLGETGRNSILYHNDGGSSEGFGLTFFSDGGCADEVEFACNVVEDSKLYIPSIAGILPVMAADILDHSF